MCQQQRTPSLPQTDYKLLGGRDHMFFFYVLKQILYHGKECTGDSTELTSHIIHNHIYQKGNMLATVKLKNIKKFFC